MTVPVEHDLPFEWGWFGMDLGRARPIPRLHVYARFPYESLPPLPQLDGTLDWLSSVDGHAAGAADRVTDADWLSLLEARGAGAAERGMDIEARIRLARTEEAAKWRRRLSGIEQEAAQVGLTLPRAYVRLMESSERLDRIPSYAGSWFSPAEHIVPCIGGVQGSLIRFLSDQQGVVVWFLYLSPHGEELVIGSHAGEIDAAAWQKIRGGAGPSAEELAKAFANAKICAPSFEAFLYRFCLECTLFRKLHGFDDAPLTSEEQRYLAHYEPTIGASST
jgi:hypothetical protein